ncbi:MAG TPA: PqqD family protein [Terriglobales bacterium]|nr:PqqD family protein [Terriglobales bacterium]
MNKFSKDTVIKTAGDQVSCTVGGEAVILQLKQGTYYGLNEVGAAIWSNLQKPKTVGQLQELMQAGFDVGEEQAERDLEDLLAQLEASGLIVVESI